MVANGGRSAIFEKDLHDFAAAHKGSVVEGGVAIAVGLLDVRFVLEKKFDDFRVPVQCGTGERGHAAFGLVAIHVSSKFEVSFDTRDASAGNGTFEKIAEVIGIDFGRAFDVFHLVCDVENEVVAEKTLGILDLEKVHPVGWRRIESDDDGLGGAFFDGGLNTPTVDDDVRVFGDMSCVHGHGSLAPDEDGELLSAALFVDRAKCPKRGLGNEESGLGSVPGGESAEELSFPGEGNELFPREALAVVINANVVIFLELQGKVLSVDEGIDLQDDGFLGGGRFECRQEVRGKVLIDGVLVEGELSGEGAGVACAAFQDHFPNGVKAWLTPPRKAPEIFFWNAFLGDISVKIEGDDIESPLWEDEKAIVGSTPGWGIHAGSGGVGRDEKGHAMTVSADVGLRFSFVVAFDVEELESVFCTL